MFCLFKQQDLLDKFSTTVQTVKHEVRPLFLPQLVRLAAMLNPALTELDWTDSEWKVFVARTLEAIQHFEILITR